jgi:DNA-binding MarR family transcriptional regulator
MDDFIHQQGPAFLAHLLRRLSDELVRAASEWYPEMGVRAPPRTASTLLLLQDRGPLGVTQIAELIRQSHPLVIGWIKQLASLEFIETRADPRDGRRSVIVLTAAGRAEVRRLRRALVFMGRASQRLTDETSGDLFQALAHMDQTTRREPFVNRLRREAAAGSANAQASTLRAPRNS